MIAIKPNDKCYTTNPGWDGTVAGNPFNIDGVERTELDLDLCRSSLDFDIVKKQSFDETGRPIPGHFHMRRTDDDSIIESRYSFGVKFTPIQHKDVFNYIVNEVMPEVPEMKLEMCGTIHGGGVGLIEAQYGDTFSIKGDDSPNKMRLFISNPVDGVGCTTLGFTTVRVKCENTLIAATHEAGKSGFKIKHFSIAPEMAHQAVLQIKEQAVAALEMKEACQRLANIGMSAVQFESFLDSIYPLQALAAKFGTDSIQYKNMARLREDVKYQFEAGETAQSIKDKSAWAAFNSATYYIFNPKKIRKNSNDRAEIAYQGMNGQVATKVLGIYDKVWEAVAA